MSELDNDELIATRRLNGLDDNLFKKINTENDIKRCEKLTEPQNANWIGISNQMAIARVLARIKELEEENAKLEAIKNEAIKRYNFESIPVQKIKDLMEKEKLPLTIVGGRGNSKTLAYGIKLGKIKACEELLEEK